MPREQIKAVIFDMDGLMFDTETICYQSYVKAAGEAGRDLPLAVYKRTLGLNRQDIKAVYLKHFAGDIPFVDRIMEKEKLYSIQHMHEHGVPKKKGLDTLLVYLREHAIKMAVASSSSRETVIDLITRACIQDYFSVVCCGDEVNAAKPDPEIFLMAAKKLDVAPKHALVLEDSKNGLKAAKAAGIRSILIPDMLDPDDEMRTLATEIRAALDEVPAYIDETNP